MRSFTKVLASSVFFGSSTPAFSSSAQLGPIGTSSAGQTFSAGYFGSQGSQGGPTAVQMGTMLTMQANFGYQQGVKPANFGGIFSIIGSNTLEAPTFSIIATSTISSSGPYLLRDTAPAYKYVDFLFVPSTAIAASSGGFVSVILHEKGNY